MKCAFFDRGVLTLGDAERLFPAVTRRTIQRDLKRLVDLGLVTDLGRGATDPNRAYRWTAPRHESR